MMFHVEQGALKTIIGELFAGNANGQARALSALSCAWGVGASLRTNFRNAG